MCGGPVRLEDYYSTGGAPRMCALCELRTSMMQEEAAWALAHLSSTSCNATPMLYAGAVEDARPPAAPRPRPGCGGGSQNQGGAGASR